MIYVGQFPDEDRIGTIRAHVLSQLAPERMAERGEGRKKTRMHSGETVTAARAEAEDVMQGWFGRSKALRAVPADLQDTQQFLRHAAALQGLDSDLSLLFGKWRHLPYWLESIWLPGETLVRPFLFDRVEEGPFFIGSLRVLAQELEEIAEASPLMRAGAADESGEIRRIRQIWTCYRDAAGFAADHSLPMWTSL